MDNGRQMRFTPEEMTLLTATFKDNLPLLKLLRKVFLPEVDPQAPLGQTVDLWMTVDLDNSTPEEALRNLKARNSLISHVEQMIMQLHVLATAPAETKAEKRERMAKDSTK